MRRAQKFLAPREIEILALAARGMTSQEIAEELGIALGTVSALHQRIRGKLGVTRTLEAVIVAWRLRLIDLRPISDAIIRDALEQFEARTRLPAAEDFPEIEEPPAEPSNDGVYTIAEWYAKIAREGFKK